MRDDDLRPLPLAADWHTRAACHPDRRPNTMTPAEWTAQWYPPQRSGRPKKKVADRDEVAAPARAICAGCPVIAQCDLDGDNEHHGVWAGQNRAKHYPSTRGASRDANRCLWCERLFIPRTPIDGPGGQVTAYCSATCRESDQARKSHRRELVRERDRGTAA